MANPFAKKLKKKKVGGLSGLRAKKVVNKGPTFLGIEIDEPDPDTLGTLQRVALKRKQKIWAASDKQDESHSGLKVGKVREHDGFWTVDVQNGDHTVRFDNRYGSWQIHPDGFDRPGREADSRVVFLVHNRWLREIKRQDRNRGYYFRDEIPREENKGTGQRTPKEPKPKKGKAPKRNRATGPANAVKDPPKKKGKAPTKRATGKKKGWGNRVKAKTA